jgi:nicotinamide-nucleotide amidase
LRIELLLTGDELTSGAVSDSNGGWLASRIAALGERVARFTVLGDDLEAVAGELRAAASRADLVVVSGGLGPTLDDLTVDAACAAFERRAVVDPAQLERIRQRFASLGRQLTPNNERQARVPEGAEVLGNDFGTATAFVVRHGGCELWFLPGVPRELRKLAEQKLLSGLRERLEAEGVFRCLRVVKCVRIAESHLDHAIAPLLQRHPHVRYGTIAAFPEVQARFVAEGGSADAAKTRCEALEREVRQVLGAVAYGGEADTLASAALGAIRSKGWKVAVAESLTAGLLSAQLADVPGASDLLLGGMATYATGLKERWLGVSPELLAREGPVSEACARAMAEGILARSGADVAVALTGLAGPGGDGSEHPPGTVFAAVAGGGAHTHVVRERWLLGRNEVRRMAAALGLDLLRRRALGLPA